MHKERAREVATSIRYEIGHNTGKYDQSYYAYSPESGNTITAEAFLSDNCRTAGCVAGWGAALSHPDWVMVQGMRIIPQDIVAAYLKDEIWPPEMFEITYLISNVAAKWLELDEEQADWLFSDDRSPNQVLWALEEDDASWNPDDAPAWDPDDLDYRGKPEYDGAPLTTGGSDGVRAAND